MAQREEGEFGDDGGSSCRNYLSVTAVCLLIGFIFCCSSCDCMEEQPIGNVFSVMNQACISPAVI